MRGGSEISAVPVLPFTPEVRDLIPAQKIRIGAAAQQTLKLFLVPKMSQKQNPARGIVVLPGRELGDKAFQFPIGFARFFAVVLVQSVCGPVMPDFGCSMVQHLKHDAFPAPGNEPDVASAKPGLNATEAIAAQNIRFAR